MKPILYGSLAAWQAGVPRTVNAFAGLGYVFNADDMKARFLRPLLLFLFRFLLKRKGSWLLFQNRDDKALMAKHGLVDETRTALIRGSGVDLGSYAVQPFQDPAPDFICAYAGRMIGIKGLQTLKEAFAILATRAPHIKLWLCGQSDPDNPGAWTEERLRAWDAQSDNVAYKGFCDDMTALWRQTHVALQVSYGGEGVPK